MESIRDMVDVNTVIGDPVAAGDGSTVIPVSRVCFGFVAGGGEYQCAKGESRPPSGGPAPRKNPFAGVPAQASLYSLMGFLGGEGRPRAPDAGPGLRALDRHRNGPRCCGTENWASAPRPTPTARRRPASVPACPCRRPSSGWAAMLILATALDFWGGKIYHRFTILIR